jgi:hypothetical protein
MHSRITANILSGLFNHHPKHFIMPYSIKRREEKEKEKNQAASQSQKETRTRAQDRTHPPLGRATYPSPGW